MFSNLIDHLLAEIGAAIEHGHYDSPDSKAGIYHPNLLNKLNDL